MKLLFVDFALPYLLRDADYPVGGWAVELKAWLTALDASGNRAGVLTWLGANAYVGHATVCDLIETYDPKRGIRVLKYVTSYLPSMVKGARGFAPAVVIQACASLETGMAAYVAGRIGVPFVHRIASDVDADDRYAAKLSRPDQAAYRYGLRRAALILCQNEYQLQALRQRYPGKPLAIVHSPFETRTEAAIRPRADRRYIAWLGVFRKPKDLPLLLTIARALPDVPFRIGGMPANAVDAETAAAVEGLKTLPNVVFGGYLKRSAVPEFLGNAIAVLSTSSFEGFSNVFLEAFAAGTPVLCRRAVDPDLIVTRNDLGITTADGPELADAVRRIGTLGAQDYAAIAERCRRYVVEHHSGAAKVGQLLSALAPLTGA